MADNIGEAQIAITVALETLQKSMQDAQKLVQETISDINKKAVVKFDGEAAKIQTEFNGISKTVNQAGSDFQKYGGVVRTVTQEASREIFGYGTITSRVFTEVTTSLFNIAASFAGMGTSVLAAAGPIAIIVVGVIGLIAEIVLAIKFIGDIIDKTQLYVGQNQELTDALNVVKDVLKLLWTGLTDIYDALVDKVAIGIFEFIKGLVETWKEMNNATGAGDGLLASLKNLMSSGFNAVMRIVETVINIFRAFSGQSDDSKSKIEGLTAVVNTMGVVLNGVAFIIEAVSRGIQTMGNFAASAVSKLQPVINAIKELLGFISQLAATGLGYYFGLNTQRSAPEAPAGPMGPDPGNRSFGTEEYGPGNLPGKNQWALEGNKSKSGSKGGSGTQKAVDLVAEEAKLLRDITEYYDKHLQLLEKGTAERNTMLEQYKTEIENLKLKLSFEANILDADIKIKNLRDEQIKSLEEEIKLQQEAYREIVTKAGKETEAVKNYLSANIEAEQKLKGLKLQAEGDVQKIAIFNIQEKYRQEIQSINLSKIAEQNKINLIAELEKKQKKEIKEINEKDSFNFLTTLQTGFNTVTNAIGSGFNRMWTSVFGEVNSLFEVLMKSISDQLIMLAGSAIFKTIVNVLSGGSTGFLSFLFAGGGFTGVGDDDEPAGIVHKNEFVVSSAGTNIAGNRELLEAMNRGEDVASLIGSYERRNITSESIRAGALSSIGAGQFAGERNVNINIDGVNVNAKIQKLTGLNENDWMDIVDNELVPQISKGLKRAGKSVLDNSIN